MTNEEDTLTYASISKSILEDMVTPIIHDIISSSILNEQVIRRDYGTIKDSKIIDSTNPLHNNINDINLLENSQLKRVKNGYSNNSSSPNSNNNSNTNSNKSTPPPSNLGLQSQPDLGRLQFIQNGRDIYFGASSLLANGSNNNYNSNINGNGSLNDDYKNGGISMNNSNSNNNNSTNDSETEYFKCLNCDRKIAGSRFAAHIDRCLGGRTRK